MVKARPASDRKVRKRAEREDRILKVAHQLFLAKGFANTTIDEIAAKADVSKGAVYLHYRTKDDIYFNVVEKGLGIMRDMFRQAADREDLGLNKFRAIGYSFYEFTKKFPEYSNIIYDTNAPLPGNLLASEGRCQALNEEIGQIMVMAIASGMKDGSVRPEVDPVAAALTISSSLQGLLKTVLSNQGFVKVLGLEERYLVDYSIDLYGRSLMNGPAACMKKT
jgi:TetR/AcrR family transcriptional regulator